MPRRTPRKSARFPSIEPVVLAAAEENQAHLAFRARKSSECLSHAQKALDAYLEAGSLTGAEGIHRLLGLYFLRRREFDPDAKVDAGAAKPSLEHFLISSELAEILRDRIPDRPHRLEPGGIFRAAGICQRKDHRALDRRKSARRGAALCRARPRPVRCKIS